MKIGNMLFPESPGVADDARRIRETLAEAALSEELGVDALWLAEHHFDGNCAYVDPITFAATLLGRTSRIDIGFAVLQTSLYHPIRLAEQLALLEILAEGRLIIGLGRGTNGNIYEYQGYDLAPEEAQARYDEITAILHQAFGEDGPINFDGRFWTIRAPAFRPRSPSHGAPRFIHGASSEKSMIERGRNGEPFLMSPQSYQETAKRLSRYRDALVQSGFDAATIKALFSQCWVWRNVYVAETDAEAQRTGGEAMRRTMENRGALRRRVFAEQGLAAHEKDSIGAVPTIPGEQQGFLCGSVETVTQEFLKLEALGVGGVICGFRPGPLPYAQASASLTSFMQNIAPQLRNPGKR